MKKILLLALFASVATSVFSQRVKYRDLVPALDTVSVSEQMILLRSYLAEDLDQANANFRIAMLHYTVFQKSDPLLEYAKAMAHAKEAVLRLTKARVVVTASDVKSDNEYYAPFFKTVDSKGRPYVEFALVQQKMNTAFDSAQNFIKNMPGIYTSFTRSVQSYDEAVKSFASINTDFKTIEDLYMYFDEGLNNRLSVLKAAYDSSLTSFKKYLDLTGQYPLPKYRQKYHIKPINVYRLDGLTTRLSFLEKDVEFWDYSDWVEKVRKKHKEEIVPIKERISSTEVKLNESLKTLQSPASGDQTYRISKDLIFQLNNYDKNSLALAILEYKAFKQSWLMKQRQVARDTALDAKLELYSQLIQLNRTADTLVTTVKQKKDPGSIKKHLGYINTYYGGNEGLEEFIRDEQEYIRNAFAQYQEVLKNGLLAYRANADQPGKTIKFGTYNVALFTDRKNPAEMDLLSLYTHRILKTADGALYVAGLHKTNKKTNNNLTAFIARVNADGKAAWYKDLNFSPDSAAMKDASNFIGDIVATQEGVALVLTSLREATGQHANNFVFVNDKGEMKTYPVKEKGFARKMIYQEASNSFVMVFKGESEKQDFQKEESVSFASINILGDLLWHQDLTFAGTVNDVIPVRDGYVMMGNYTAMKDLKGNESRTKIALGQSNPYLAKISLKGEKVNVQPITSSRSIILDKVVKVNDGSINLLGYEASFNSAERGALMHMMTAYDLKQICSNFN